MSGSKTISTSEPRLGTLRVQTSMYGLAIPLAWGTPALVGNLVWFGNFQAIAHTSTSSQGGKGGGGVKTVDTKYEYRAAAIMGLCRGPVNGIVSAWQGKKRLQGVAVAARTDTLGHSATVPGSPYQVTVSGAATYLDTTSVVIPGTAGYSGREADFDGTPELALVAGIDYTVAAGVYTFAAARAGSSVVITYRTTTVASVNSALSQLGLSLASGTVGQAFWAWLQTNYASQAQAYSGLAYVYNDSYQLTNQAEVENLRFEVATGRQVSPTIADADPTDVLADFLTNPYYGCGWRTGRLAAMTQFRNYVRARQLWLSPSMTEQRPAREWLQGLADITNSEWTWQGGTLDLVPRGDEALTSAFGTFTPNTTPVFDLVHAEGGDLLGPVQIDPVVNEDAKNIIRIEWTNRANGYLIEVMDARDAAHIEQFGERPADVVAMHAIHDAAVARSVAQQLLQRQMTVWNRYTFRTSWARALMGLMDLVTLTDADSALSRVPVRIRRRAEKGKQEYEFEAEDAPIGAASAPQYGSQAGGGFAPDYNAAPGSISTPVIFEGPGALAVNGLELFVAAAGVGANWGGCRVWMSLDGSNYKEACVMYGPSRYGTLTAAAAVSGVIKVSLLASSLLSGSAADATALNTLCYIGGSNKEFVAYETATLTAALAYDLAGATRRGAYGTVAATHASGDTFVRVDQAVGRSGPIDLGYAGKTVSLKFTSFNQFGLAEESLAGAMAYSYTLTGSQINQNVSSVQIKSLRAVLGTPLVLGSALGYGVDSCPLTATTTLVVWVESGSPTGKCRAAVVTNTAGVLSNGTIVDITTNGTYSGGGAPSIAAIALSAIKCLVAYLEGSTGRARAMVLDISGTTITTNTAVDFAAEVGSHPGLVLLSSTKAFACYHNPTSGYTKGLVLDVSGSTVTANVTDSLAQTSTVPALTALNATSALVAFKNGSSRLCAAVFTVSGSSTSHGSIYTLDGSSTADSIDVAAINATSVALTYNASGTPKVGLILVSGTTVLALGTLTNLGSAGDTDIQPALMTTNELLLFTRTSAGTIRSYTLASNGSIIAPLEGTSWRAASTAVGSLADMSKISASEIMLGHYDTSGSPLVAVLIITVS